MEAPSPPPRDETKLKSRSWIGIWSAMLVLGLPVFLMPLSVKFLWPFQLGLAGLYGYRWTQLNSSQQRAANRTSIALLGLSFVLAFAFHSKSAQERRESDARRVAKQSNLGIRTNHIAKILKHQLREADVNGSLIIDVQAANDDPTAILVRVSNAWLSRPYHERQQMRKILEAKAFAVSSDHRPAILLVDNLGSLIGSTLSNY